MVESSRHVRAAGYVGGAPFERRLVHEMRNPGEAAAVSLHLYAYRPDRHVDSIDRRFERAPGAEEQP